MMRFLGVVLLGVFLGLSGLVVAAHVLKPTPVYWYKIYFVHDQSMVAMQATGVSANGTCSTFLNRRGAVEAIVCTAHTVVRMAAPPPADVPRVELSPEGSGVVNPTSTVARN